MPRRPTPLTLAIACILGGLSAPAGAGFIISSTVTTAQTLATGTGEVTASGTLAVSGTAIGIAVTGNAAIANSGVIEQLGTGRSIRDNTNNTTLTVTNHAGARISSADNDTFQVNQTNVTVTLENFGEMRSYNASKGGAQVVDWNAVTTAANSLYNRVGGVIEAAAADAVRPGVNGVIDNAGTIGAVPAVEGSSPSRTASSSDGIDAQTSSGVVVTNTGAIAGRHGITGGGAAAPVAITVTNESAGTISGVNGSGLNIDGAGSSATVVNHGSITGRFDATRYDSGDGDGVDIDGTVQLTNHGIIRGVDASGGSNPEGVSIGGGTVINQASAQITGESTLGNGAAGHGLLADDSNGGSAYAATQITNAGLIRGHQGYAVNLVGSFADTIDNQADGTLRGAGNEAAVQSGGGNDTVTNAGAIVGDGGLAVDLGDGDDTLTIVGGAASIVGAVSGGAGTNILVMDLGAGHALTYQGVMSDFSTTDLKSGSAALAGRIDGVLRVSAGAVLAPGNSVGTLDLAGLALSASGVLAIDLDPTNTQGHGTSDQVRVSGAVDLGLADLVLTLYSVPTLGQLFDLLLTGGTAPVTGRFAQGDLVSADFVGHTYWFAIDYTATADGGSQGNDLRLTAVPVPGSAWLFGLGALGLGLGRCRRSHRTGPDSGAGPCVCRGGRGIRPVRNVCSGPAGLPYPSVTE